MHKICITKVYRLIMFHDGQIAVLSVMIKFINYRSSVNERKVIYLDNL